MFNRLEESNIQFCPFYEPDIGNELTAICLMPSEEAKELTKGMKLAKLKAPVAQQGERPVLNWKGESASLSGCANAEVAQLVER